MSGRRSARLGQRAESIALEYLADRGLDLVERNFRCKLGELDLVMRDGDILIVAEIRYRRNNDFGSPAETVDQRKQRKLVASTELLLRKRPELAALVVRFDVVALSAAGSAPRIEWIRDAFRPAG